MRLSNPKYEVFIKYPQNIIITNVNSNNNIRNNFKALGTTLSRKTCIDNETREHLTITNVLWNVQMLVRYKHYKLGKYRYEIIPTN